MEYKIMVIEDDEKLRCHITDTLVRYGFGGIGAVDFQNILPLFEQVQPHLVLVDVNLPFYDGFVLCRQIRRSSKVPIFILSARNSNMDQIMGIEAGADDYITKPVDLELLLSKIKALLRRAYGEYSGDQNSILAVHGLSLDENAFRLSFNGRCADLSKNEQKLMKKFMENKDRVLSREVLLEALWDEKNFVDDNTLTVNVTRLKGKCEELGLPEMIKTKRGVGYVLDSNALRGYSP